LTNVQINVADQQMHIYKICCVCCLLPAYSGRYCKYW